MANGTTNKPCNQWRQCQWNAITTGYCKAYATQRRYYFNAKELFCVSKCLIASSIESKYIFEISTTKHPFYITMSDVIWANRYVQLVFLRYTIMFVYTRNNFVYRWGCWLQLYHTSQVTRIWRLAFEHQNPLTRQACTRSRIAAFSILSFWKV